MIGTVDTCLVEHVAQVRLQARRDDEVVETPADVARASVAKVRPKCVRVTHVGVELAD